MALFGKSIKDISRDFSSGHGVFTSLFSNSVTSDDVKRIQNFMQQIKSGIPTGQAWKDTMAKATVAGKDMAVKVKSGAVSLDSLTAATNTSKLAMIGMQAATMALNMALTFGLATAIQFLVKGLDNLIHSAKNASESADELKEKSVEEAKAAKDEAKQIDDLIKKYKELAESDTQDNSTRNEIKDIQGQIVNLVGEQANNLDLVNGKLDDELAKLYEIQRVEAEKAVETATGAYHNSKQSANSAIGKKSRFSVDGYEYTGKVSKAEKDALGNYINAFSIQGALVGGSYGLNFKDTEANLKQLYNIDVSTIQGKIDALNEMIERVKTTEGYAESDLYAGLISARDYYEGYVDDVSQAAQSLADAVITASTYNSELAEINVNSVESLGAYRDKLVDIVESSPDLSEVLSSGDISTENVENYIDQYIGALDRFSDYYSDWRKQFAQDSSNATVMTSDDKYSSIRKKVEDFRSAIYAQMKEMSEGGKVDLTVRPVIDASELEKAGWKDAGEGAATVFTSTFSNEAGDIAMNFTPIMVDDKGNYIGSLSPDELTEYAEGVVNGTRSDDLNLKIGSTFIGDSAIEGASEQAEKIHQLQEQYYLTSNEFKEWYDGLNDKEKDIVYSISLNTDGAEASLEYFQDALYDSEYHFTDLMAEQDTDTQKSFSTRVDEYVQKIGVLKEALNKLNKGQMTNTEIYTLLHQFPQLVGQTDNLSDAIRNLALELTGGEDELGNFSGIYADFQDQFGRIDSDDDKQKLEEFMDTVLELGEVVGGTEFSIDIEAETAGMESLWTAMKQSVTSTGLTSESIRSLKERYQDLEDYDAARLFEKTTNGIHLNTKALRELESAYEKQKKNEINDSLQELAEQYDDLTIQINETSDAAKKAELYAQRSEIKDQIDDTAMLAAQYEGLTSAFYKWEQAQSIGEEGDMYDSMAGSLENIKKLYDDGLIGTNKFRTAVQLMSNEDLSTASIDELLAAYDAGYSKMTKYFTESSDGCLNFLNDVQKLNSEWVHMNEDGSWDINFGVGDDQNIADALGINVESVQSILRKLSDYGFDVNLDSIYTSLSMLKSDAEKANQSLIDLGKTKVTFDFNTNDLDKINEQIPEAQELLDGFKNSDGTVNLSLEGAEEAQQILVTLISQKQQISAPAIMDIDTTALSEADSEIANAFKTLQEFVKYSNDLEIETALGIDTHDTQEKIQSVADELSGIPDEVKTKLGLDNESFQTAIDNIKATEVNVEAGVSLKDGDIESVQSAIDGITPKDIEMITNSDLINKELNGINEYKIKDKSFQVSISNDPISKLSNINSYTIKDKSYTITARTVRTGTVEVNGTAHVNGTVGKAFKRGSWGTKESGTALGGELGMELAVDPSTGKYFTIGENGAEFFNYKRGTIIFNHLQTEELLKNGRVTSGGGRGTAFITGNAFSNGVGKITASGKVKTTPSGKSSKSSKSKSKTNSKSKNKSAKDSENVFDWIEVAIDRIERAIKNLDTKANSVFKSWTTRNKNLSKEISKVSDEISLQEKAYNAYIKAANSVGLAKKWRDKVKNGTMDISTIKDEKLAEKIKNYQTWYEKAIDCKDAIVELKEKEAELYKQRFDNVAAKFDGIITEYDNHRSILEEFVNQATAKGRIISEKYYTEIQDNENKKLKKLQKERDELLTSLEEAVSSGKIEVGSEAWREMCNSVDEVNLAIEQCNTSLLELEKTMRELKWEQFDLIHDKISQVTSEADFMIDLMSHKKLYDDNGQLTNEGQATMGLHGQNYNVYMEQAKRITSELQELEKEIADDPYNQDLINRRQELLELRQDMVLAAEDEKDAMIDMVKEGIELELDALQELINNYTKALDAQKSLYDYQKKVKSQTEDIAKLQKQLAAYAGDDSEEGKAKRQKLKDSLKSAQEQLEETEYDKYISDQKELLDELYSEYEEVLNKRLDNTDALIGDLIDGVNQNASAISDTLNQAANDVGITLSDELQSIWSSEEPVLTRYGDGIAGSVTSISATLDRIAVSVADMVANSQKEAETDVKKETAKPTSTTTQANAKPKESTTTTKKTTTTTSKTTTTKKSTTSKTGSGNGKAEVGDKVTFKSGKYYETPEGTGKSGSQYLGKSVYITKIDKKAKKPYHISSGKKLGSGNLGWLSLSQLKGYRTGTRRVNDDELAWTNENRDSEVIIRPSDGAILTPLKTGDAVLNPEATSNMFDFASNPEQFLRDIIGTDRIGADMSHVVSAGNTHNGDINMTFDMKDVTNYEEFKYALQHDKSFERMVRAMTTDRLFGKDSHRKYHV